MSSLRKSASFRSRIPVRRTRVSTRRCVSPQPSTSTVTSTGSMYDVSGGGGGGGGRQWYERRYSSSSYSSSDESHDESEMPLKLLLKHSPAAMTAVTATADGRDRTRQQQQHHLVNLSVSTDAISLDGLLDCVSSGSFSSPPSPKGTGGHGRTTNSGTGEDEAGIYQNDPHHHHHHLQHQPNSQRHPHPSEDNAERITTSSCSSSTSRSASSLEELNYALETLKISDTFHADKQAVNQHYENLINETSDLEDPQQRALNQQEDADSKKQRKLSDWYYIKTSPTKLKKAPPPAASPCVERRNRPAVITRDQQRPGSPGRSSNPVEQQLVPPVMATTSSGGGSRQGQVLLTKVLIASKYSSSPAGVNDGHHSQQQQQGNSNLVNSNKFSSPVLGARRFASSDVSPPPKPVLPPQAAPRWHYSAATARPISPPTTTNAATMAINDRNLSPPVTGKCFGIVTRPDISPDSGRPPGQQQHQLDITSTSSSFEHIPEIIGHRFSPYCQRKHPQNIYENFPANRIAPPADNQFPQPYDILDTTQLQQQQQQLQRYKKAVKRPLPRVPASAGAGPGPPAPPPVPPLPSAVAVTAATAVAIEYGEEDDDDADRKKKSSLTRRYLEVRSGQKSMQFMFKFTKDGKMVTSTNHKKNKSLDKLKRLNAPDYIQVQRFSPMVNPNDDADVFDGISPIDVDTPTPKKKALDSEAIAMRKRETRRRSMVFTVEDVKQEKQDEWEPQVITISDDDSGVGASIKPEPPAKLNESFTVEMPEEKLLDRSCPIPPN